MKQETRDKHYREKLRREKAQQKRERRLERRRGSNYRRSEIIAKRSYEPQTGYRAG